MTGCS